MSPHPSSSTVPRHALVIGGGVAGPVVAAALVKAGWSATVYEAYPQSERGVGNALALAPNGLAALDVLGAGDPVRAAGLPITASRMAVGRRVLGELPALPGVEPQRMIDRGVLHRILRENAAAGGVRFEYEKRLVAADPADTGGVTATFADGSSATGDVLIGADGVRSLVRALIDPRAPEADYTGLLGFGGTVEDEDEDEGGRPAGCMTFAFGRRAYYLYWTLPGGRVAWGANLPSEQYLSLTEARDVPAAEWLARLQQTYAGDDPGERLAGRTTAQTLEVLGAIHIMPPVPHWYRGRMVLVGDAVHCPSNSTGQGAALAIESAVQLARCLRDIPEPEAAFAAYEKLRRERVEKIAERGARTNRTKTPGHLGRAVLRLVLPLLLRLNPEKTLGAEQRYRIDWAAPVMAPSPLARA